MAITKAQVELVQGINESDEAFGYVAGNDGGFFFDWKSTLEATLASVDEDDQDGAGGLKRSSVVKFLRGYLPQTARGKRKWS